MLIESIIKRQLGTKVTLRHSYHFKPDDDGRHVAEVEDDADIAALLAIKEGFRPANGTLAVLSEALPLIEGAYFIIRGPQDMEAFLDWERSVPHMREEPLEFVALVDKIAIGEASLDGFQLIPNETPARATAGVPSMAGPSPRPSADNSIMPTDQTQTASPSADTDGSQATGDGGADAAGGVGTDSDQAEEDEDEEGDAPPPPPPPPPPPTPPPAAPSAADLDREALAKEYDELIGHRPNGRWSAARIAEALAEHKAKA